MKDFEKNKTCMKLLEDNELALQIRQRNLVSQ